MICDLWDRKINDQAFVDRKSDKVVRGFRASFLNGDKTEISREIFENEKPTTKIFDMFSASYIYIPEKERVFGLQKVQRQPGQRELPRRFLESWVSSWWRHTDMLPNDVNNDDNHKVQQNLLHVQIHPESICRNATSSISSNIIMPTHDEKNKEIMIVKVRNGTRVSKPIYPKIQASQHIRDRW